MESQNWFHSTIYDSNSSVVPSLSAVEDHSNPMYFITKTKIVPEPTLKCQSVRGTPCPEGKTSYWRSFGIGVRDGGCGEPKKICGATIMPTKFPPHYVIEPVHDKELIKFF
jgi:hypothetical protein